MCKDEEAAAVIYISIIVVVDTVREGRTRAETVYVGIVIVTP